MKKAFKKAISVLLVAVMMLGTAPFAGFIGLELPEFNLFSTKADAATSGICGENVTWEFDETKCELIISGTGEMKHWYYGERVPWSSYSSLIRYITINNGVTIIGRSAFSECVSLKNVTIPNSVTKIGLGAFEGCIDLESITIPNSVTIIGTGAFYDCISLENVIIGNGVTNIGEDAFYGCTNLASVAIPDSVTNIGILAFGKCLKLTSITVDSDNTAYSNDEYGALFNKDKTELIQYPAGKPEKNYVIPDSVRTIGKAAFNYSSNLESVTISNRVTSIGVAAFTGCTNLKSITIPKSLTAIGSNVFPACDNIKDIYYEGSKTDWKNVGIGSNNGTLLTAKVHYNYRYNGGSTEIPDNTPAYDSSVVDTFLVATPTETIISYGDSIVLHIDPSKIPEGGRVEWYASNENFTYSVSSFGTTCTISPSKSGDTTFTAIVYDAQGNIVSADNQEMTSKSGFFDKFIAFFKKLFGLTKTIPEAIKTI